MNEKPTILATVECINDTYGTVYARCEDGSRWAIPDEHIEHLYEGDEVLIKIHDPQDQYCTFVRKVAGTCC